MKPQYIELQSVKDDESDPNVHMLEMDGAEHHPRRIVEVLASSFCQRIIHRWISTDMHTPLHGNFLITFCVLFSHYYSYFIDSPRAGRPQCRPPDAAFLCFTSISVAAGVGIWHVGGRHDARRSSGMNIEKSAHNRFKKALLIVSIGRSLLRSARCSYWFQRCSGWRVGSDFAIFMLFYAKWCAKSRK